MSATVKVMDVLGKVLQVQQWSIYEGDNSFEWNLSQLPEGTYLLELSSGAEISTERFVIAR